MARKAYLKRQRHEIFDFRVFFHESVSSMLPSIPLGQFRIFSKIGGDIRSSRCTTSVNDTGGKWKKSSTGKVGGKFATNLVDTGGVPP
jgi:hypothetical protein